MIHIAVIGAGRWGPNIINNLEAGSRSLVRYVVDKDEQRLSEIQKRFPAVIAIADPKIVFDDPEIDAVVIATPTSTHYELVTQALNSGKHVFVEKPLTHSVETSKKISTLAKEVDRIVMVGHVFVYNSASRKVRELVQQGTLGQIYYLSMVRTNLGPIRVDVDAAWDLAAHDISMANFWLDALPLSVSAASGTFINDGVADVVFANIRYPNDILVTIHASWLNPVKARDITIVGEKRMLTFDDVDLATPIRIFDKQVKENSDSVELMGTFESFRTSVHEGEVETPFVEKTQPLRNECDHFIDCLENGVICESGPTEGINVVRVLEAISMSAQAGREVAIGDA